MILLFHSLFSGTKLCDCERQLLYNNVIACSGCGVTHTLDRVYIATMLNKKKSTIIIIGGDPPLPADHVGCFLNIKHLVSISVHSWRLLIFVDFTVI